LTPDPNKERVSIYSAINHSPDYLSGHVWHLKLKKTALKKTPLYNIRWKTEEEEGRQFTVSVLSTAEVLYVKLLILQSTVYTVS
jgi:hypothetical protein